MVKKRNLLTPVFALALLVSTVFAQVAQPVDRNSILQASENILKEMCQMRGLPAKNPVKSGFKSQNELETIIVRDLDEETTPEELTSQSRLLVRLGLAPKGFAIREEMIKLLKEQIGGFYEPRTGEFYLVDWLDLDEQRPVIAHELMHAIQDQNFNLRRFEKFPKDESDQELAIQALIEGEATVMMFNYMFKPQGLDITKVPVPLSTLMDSSNKTDADRFPVLANTPKAIRETLEFPYFQGASFVQEVVRKSSWQRIADLYTTELPESTEQILHPDKFLAGEHPVKVKMPDLLTHMGKGWRQSNVNVQGEFGYFLILAEHIDKAQAREAAAGWGGDQYIFFDRAEGEESVLVQLSTWDREKDATEFFQAYTDRTLKLYKQAKPVKSEENIKVYATDSGLVHIERRGSLVLIIEGANETQLAMRDAVWKDHTLANKPMRTLEAIKASK